MKLDNLKSGITLSLLNEKGRAVFNYIEYDNFILCENEKVGRIKYSIRSKDVIKIETISLNQEHRGKGIGTCVVLLLRNKFKGYMFYGDILYPLAFNFWKSLEDKVSFIEPLECYNEYECCFCYK